MAKAVLRNPHGPNGSSALGAHFNGKRERRHSLSDPVPRFWRACRFRSQEREVIGERIRDKIAASKRKGMWMGGVPPLGYRVEDRKLLVIDGEAEVVRAIFHRYAELGSVRLLKQELDARGIKSDRCAKGANQSDESRRARPFPSRDRQTPQPQSRQGVGSTTR